MIYFIGAGPGDPELLTLKAHRLLRRCPVVLYAGSLIPNTILQFAGENAEIHNTAELHLQEIIQLLCRAHDKGLDVARLHSGDTSLYSAIGEQINALRSQGIPYEVIPGVTAASASAAALGCELTRPEVAQTVIYTRYAGKTPFPERERLGELAKHGTTLVIHLGVVRIHKICEELQPHYGRDCPVAVVYRASWPDQIILRGTLDNIVGQVRKNKICRSATILVGPSLGDDAVNVGSYLYNKDQAHLFRPKYKQD